jgi:anaerobic ribonucleoside-triphosphate reductase activating protein
MKIALSRLHFPVTTLGPGRRIGIWFQGCSIHCVGCVSKDTWAPDINQVDIEEVENALLTWLPQADGITISGGEPFDQVTQLERLLRFIKSNTTASTLVYTGYHFEKIKDKLTPLNSLIDGLISEPFDYRQPQTLPLRGSDNQRLHLLTAIGEAVFSTLDYAAAPQRQFDAMLVEEGAWLVGIGEQDLMHQLAVELARDGHEITHTQTQLPEQE